MSRVDELHYKLFVINTDYRIPEIIDFLKERTKNPKEIGPIRKDFTRNAITREYSEKSRKLMFLDNGLYNRLKNSGYGENGNKSDDFEIHPYIVTNQEYAHRTSSVMHYYFPLESDSDNIAIMRKRLTRLEEMGILKTKTWHVHESGVVEFSKDVKRITRMVIKIMLDDPSVFRVSWMRKEPWTALDHHFPENA
jgi:hypothetical protein